MSQIYVHDFSRPLFNSYLIYGCQVWGQYQGSEFKKKKKKREREKRKKKKNY